jgi:hypothetical protein
MATHLLVAVESIVHAQCSTHLGTSGQNAISTDGDSPMCEMVVRKPSHERAEECQDGSNGAGWKTHLWLSDTMVPLGIEIRNAVSHGPA